MKVIKRTVLCVLCLSLLLSFVSCEKNGDKNTSTNPPSNSEPTIITAYMTVKDFGNITIELYPEYAPQSVYNFVYLANSGHYNGIVFHRIVKDFVIQAGAYETGYVERPLSPDYTILGEFAQNGVENKLSHSRGVISWARRSMGEDPYNSASSQFFICLNDSSAQSLDGAYAAFGRVTAGMEVVDAIAAVTCSGEVPMSEVMITSVTIDGKQLPEPDFMHVGS